MNVSVIKKTKYLNRLSLAETMAIIKACDLDAKQREINHVNSYSSANLGIQSNNAFSSFTTPQVQSFPIYQPTSYVIPSVQNVQFSQTPTSFQQVGSSSDTSVQTPRNIPQALTSKEND